MTGEFVNYSRDLPRVLHTALPIVIVSYVLANLSYYFVLPVSVINSSNTVAVAFGQQVAGRIGAIILALAVCGSCFGALNATTFTSGRLIYAAGQEGYLPEMFGRIGIAGHNVVRLGSQRRFSNPNRFIRLIADDVGMFYTPVNAMVLNMMLTAVYIVIGEFSTLLTFYGVAGYSFYFFAVLGVIILRVKEPELERPYKTWITTPIIFCCVSIFLLSRAAFAQPGQALIVVTFVLAGVPVYFLWVRRKGSGRGVREKTGSGWKFWRRWRRN